MGAGLLRWAAPIRGRRVLATALHRGRRGTGAALDGDPGRRRRPRADRARAGRQRGAGGLDRPRPRAATGIVRLRGRFTATWHGGDWTDDLPPVRGRVERIQLVRELFEETHGAVPDDHSSTWHAAGGGRTFIVVPGAEDLADVEMAPDPTDEPDLDLRSGAYRELTGYRVDLQLLG